MHSDKNYVSRALQAGATGYLLKDAAQAELEVAVRAVVRGETYLSPAISTQLIQHTLRPFSVHGEREERGEQDQLTERQREVLQLIAEGHTTKAIAGTLHLSVKTIETHRAQLMTRLDIHNLADLVRYAVRTGLVTSEM